MLLVFWSSFFAYTTSSLILQLRLAEAQFCTSLPCESVVQEAKALLGGSAYLSISCLYVPRHHDSSCRLHLSLHQQQTWILGAGRVAMQPCGEKQVNLARVRAQHVISLAKAV